MTGADVHEALHITAQVDRDAVELGHGFALQVTRSWPRSQAVLPFDESALAPLVVVRGRVTTGFAHGVSTEVRSYTAYAFALGPVETAPLAVRIRTASGEVQTALGEPIVLQVTSALAEGAGLKAELPSESLALPSPEPGWELLFAMGSMVLAAGWIAWRRRTSPPPRKASLPPLARALERLSLLERSGRAWRMRHGADELARLLRELLAVAAVGRVPAETRARHADLIARLERARFAGDRVDPATVSGWMVETRAVVEDVRSAEAASPHRSEAARSAQQCEVGP